MEPLFSSETSYQERPAPVMSVWSLSPHWPLLLLPFAHSAPATLAFRLFPTLFPGTSCLNVFVNAFPFASSIFFPRYLYILFFCGSLLGCHNFVRPSGHSVSDYSPLLTCFISCLWFIFFSWAPFNIYTFYFNLSCLLSLLPPTTPLR